MKNVNLRQALEEVKKAKTLAQRLAATSNLMNQTAYKAGQYLYGVTSTEESKSSSFTDQLSKPEPTIEIAPDQPSPAVQTTKQEEVDYFTKGLMQINEELKALRLAKEKAETDVESHAIHFKILRLERERRNYLAQRNLAPD